MTAVARRAPQFASVLELLKPVTWFPPMWAFGCGVVSLGGGSGSRWITVLAGVLLAGPMVCGTSQAVNDWFDRHVDAINEPGRPIPSGRIPGQWGLYIALVWTGASLALAATLGRPVILAAVGGLALAWAYSAPPFRLKANGWWGNSAVALCYEGLPWFTGAAVTGDAMPGPAVTIIALLYSVGAHGIMTLNDFKAVDGDTQMGIASLPVQLGTRGAALWTCAVMVVPQAVVVALLLVWRHPIHGAIVAVLLLAQLALMRRFLRDPTAKALWFSANAVSLYVLGMLVSAFALRAGLPVQP